MSKPSKIAKFMETVKPTRIWIDGKCHDVLKYDKKAKEIIATEEHKERFTREYDINVVEDRYHTSFKLASVYYKKIHTYRKFTVEELENDTGTEINVPKEDFNEKVVIKGSKIEDVIEARLKLQSWISTIRDQHTAMQFVAIPIQSNEIKENFAKFKEVILEDQSNINGMDTTIFQKPERLHLTVAVFALMDTVEIFQAVNVLHDCKTNIIDPLITKTGPLKIHVKGLDCMNENYSKVNVMYANAKFCDEEDENTLQNTVDAISKEFYLKGLVRQPQSSVKLHVTLINTKFRKNKNLGKRLKMPFDATKIMEKYKDYDFGVADFQSIQLSYISSIDVNGFYKALSSINV